jgi:hypothetical protein
LPLEATRGGAATMYPEFMLKMRTMKPPPAPARPPASVTPQQR